MPKRKRTHRGKEEVDPTQETELKKEEIGKKLVHGRKVLSRALKTARGFERQKLSKRIKIAAAKQDGGEAQRLEMEQDILKTLDLPMAAESHIYKTIMKLKSIRESGLLPRYVESGMKTNRSLPKEQAAMSNVTARLYNTKPVKEAISYITGSIYTIIGIPNPSQNTRDMKVEGIASGMNSKERAKDVEHHFDNDDVDIPSSLARDESRRVHESPPALATSDPEPNSNSDLESDDPHESDNSHDRLVRASSDEENNGLIKSVVVTRHSNGSLERPEEQDDPLSSLSQSSQSPSRPSRRSKPTQQAQRSSSKLSSTFLPTLMGGYWSGSESGTDDEDLPARKKNRPGQQARRALWEKKFGAGANHLKGQVSGSSRDKDWDLRKGARGAEEGRFTRGRASGKGGKSVNVRNRGQSTGENAIAIKPRVRVAGKKDDAGPLHPSWEAAKKAKEAEQTAAFQGKRVVFE